MRQAGGYFAQDLKNKWIYGMADCADMHKFSVDNTGNPGGYLTGGGIRLFEGGFLVYRRTTGGVMYLYMARFENEKVRDE